MAWSPRMDIFKEFARSPDRELLLWEEWVKIRTDEVLDLGKKTEQPPADLAMNELEFARGDMERKRAIVDAQVLTKKVVKDSHYEKARRLKKLCRCFPGCTCENVYRLHKTAAEKQRLKVIEHIDCPDYIKVHEKGVIGKSIRKPHPKIDAEYHKYREKREEELNKPLSKTDPYRSDIRELVVIGKRPRTPPKKPPRLPLIAISEPFGPDCEPLSGVYAIRINNTVLIKTITDQKLPHLRSMQEQPWHENCRTWTYYFNVPEKRIGRSSITLENLGTVTLRYCWKKVKIVIPYIPEEVYEQKFFFYKNEDLIVPGQSKTINFTFLSEYTGIHSETWELKILNINIFDVITDKLHVNLIGDAVENVKYTTKKIERLHMRIYRKATIKFITDYIDKIIIKATTTEPEGYPYKKMLLEAEMFQLLNPVCFYHQTEVAKLKKLYTEMTGKVWNLSISSWRQAMINKKYEERMNYYDILKTSHNDVLLKPWVEGEDLKTVKYRVVKVFLGKLIDNFHIEYERVATWNGLVDTNASKTRGYKLMTPVPQGPLTQDIVRHIFYMRIMEHAIHTVEECAAALSSLDLSRWIDFNFCQY